MINTIIFDIGRVLVSFEPLKYLDTYPFDSATKETIASALFGTSTWDELDRGVLSIQELLEGFCAEAPGLEEEIREVFINYPSCIQAYSYAYDWIKGLKEQGYKIYYLSNYSGWVKDITKKELGFMELCDGGLMSYEVHMIKPEKGIYQALLDKYRILPQEAIFIDDNQANIEAAQKLDFHTILFKNYEDACIQLNMLIKNLKN